MRINPSTFTPELYFEGGLEMEVSKGDADLTDAQLYEQLGRDLVEKITAARKKHATDQPWFTNVDTAAGEVIEDDLVR